MTARNLSRTNAVLWFLITKFFILGAVVAHILRNPPHNRADPQQHCGWAYPGLAHLDARDRALDFGANSRELAEIEQKNWISTAC